jgi:hypothetical protein
MPITETTDTYSCVACGAIARIEHGTDPAPMPTVGKHDRPAFTGWLIDPDETFEICPKCARHIWDEFWDFLYNLESLVGARAIETHQVTPIVLIDALTANHDVPWPRNLRASAPRPGEVCQDGDTGSTSSLQPGFADKR